MTLEEKIDEIIQRLDRIEKRQITVREEIKDVTPVVGTFGTFDTG